MYSPRPASRFAGSLRTTHTRCMASQSAIVSSTIQRSGRRLRQARYSSSLSKELSPYPSNGRPKRVAVIGGGITGLTAAFRLSQDASTNVTLFEKSSRLGGWLQSSCHNLDVLDAEASDPHNDGSPRLLFEHGPRTFRGGCPGVLASLELV